MQEDGKEHKPPGGSAGDAGSGAGQRAVDTAFHLSAIVESSDDAIISKDLNGIIQSWNGGAQRMFGYTPEEAIGRHISILIPPERGDEEDRILAQITRGERVDHFETVRRRKDGSLVDISLTVSPIRDTEGRIVGASKTARDITERRHAEEAVRANEEQFRTLADHIAQLVWMADAKGWIYWYNKRWYDFTGTTLEEMQGWGWKKVHHPDHVDRVVARIQHAWDTGEPWEDIFPLRSSEGEYRWFLSRAVPIRDSSGRVMRWLGTNTDVTEQRAAEQALRHGALHDALTDLPNRAYFIELVSQAIARHGREPSQGFAVLLLDCDGFKAINDTFGHAAGDQLLLEISRRLRNSVRPGDVVARLGGDEFTVLLDNVTSAEDVAHAAGHIQAALGAPLQMEEREITPSASIGAALAEPAHARPEDLLRDADVAMYHAKQQGGARFEVFDKELRESAQVRSQLEAGLREALARRELRLVFQPVMALETGEVRGFEALVRWQRPKGELVMPIDLIRLAEQIGMILPIGNWVLREACRQASRWQQVSSTITPVRVSVNVSRRQLEHPDLVAEIRTALDETGLPPYCLALEIAERVLVENVDASRDVVQRLQDLGVEVYMDDFGAAYSSLTYPALFPLKGIKIDRTLVQRMGGRRTDLNVVRLIMDMAQSRGLDVIAVGIETIAQRERLIAFGCEEGQGHLFARPLEAQAAEQLLATGPGRLAAGA